MRNWLPLSGYQSYTRIRRTGLLRASPPFVLAMGFVALIVLGTTLLSLHAASTQPVTVLQAFFMATSAVTVTGLTVVDPATAFTHFGQIVMALLVQMGGLGFVTLAVVATVTLGKRMSISHQALALEAFNQTSVSKIHNTALTVFRITVVIELIGALILALWWSRDYPWTTAIYRALFHAVTAFNNAGFSLFPESMASFANDPITLLTISACIILGGIGFSVLSDIGRKRQWSTLTPYTKIMLLGTLGLNLFGFFAIWGLERNNPGTIGNLPWYSQALTSWTQAVSTRTAGFATMDMAHMHDSSALLMMMLMFIGGGSLSTASGIKIGTFIVLLAATRSYIFHRQEVVLLNRSISQSTVQKSLALLLVTAALVFVGVLLITILEKAPFIDILFEVISAVSTTGLSRDLTPHLSGPSQVLIAIIMYAGRLGPLTLVYSIATQRRSRIRYPEAEFQVG